jgi:hypothetical protein
LPNLAIGAGDANYSDHLLDSIISHFAQLMEQYQIEEEK